MIFFSLCLMSMYNLVGYNRPDSLFTYKEKLNPVLCPLFVHCCLVSLCLHTIFGKSSLLILAFIDFVNLLATLPPPRQPYISIATPVLLGLFLRPPQLISKNLLEDLLFFYWQTTLLALFSQSTLASKFFFCTNF